ncbi:MAG TPA: NB-ARC domain-containing protein, partial [Nocardioidaceae bacterium]
DFPPLRTLDQRRHNLPVHLTSFVGRERELDDVRRALADWRLVTLTGVGGSGKSRLALQAAAELVDDYPDGAWLVELAPLTEPERVPSAVAAVLAIPEDPHRPLLETLSTALRGKRLLLVVDNCEHLLSACAELTETLLKAAPGLRILATSREGLAVPGEVVVPVPPLPVPPEGNHVGALVEFPAVRLFAERARAAHPAFTVTPANAAAVTQIVTELDGIPLALELAAARVRAFSVEQIAARLSDRFRLLGGGNRTAPARQQTLRAAMDWSYDLLAPAERMLLRRLSVFRGSWSIEAAETVCCRDSIDVSEVVDLLGRLVDKSLVGVVAGAHGNRYRLLEIVRQYGSDRLDEADESTATHAAHRDWCLATVEAATVHIRGGEEQASWLEALESEHDNIQAALEWSWRVGDATASLRIAVGAAWFWYLRGHWDEARRSLEHSVGLQGVESALRAEGGAWAAVFAWRRGDLARAAQHARASMTVLSGSGDEGEGLSLLVLSLVAISRFEHEQADAYGRQALAVFRAQQHSWGVTTSLLVLAHVALNRQSGEVAELVQQSAALLGPGTDKWGQAQVLDLQGHEALRALNLDLAMELHSASHAIAVELGDRAGQAKSLLALGHVHLLRGEEEDAARTLAENRSIVEQLQEPHDLAHADQGLALLAVSRGDVASGELLLEDVARRLAAMGKSPMGISYALGMADLYRRGGRPGLAAVLLRHALSLLDEGQSPAQVARTRQELSALESATADTSSSRQEQP